MSVLPVHPSALADRIDLELRRPLEKLLALVGPRSFQGIADLTERRLRFEEVMAVAAARGPDEVRVARRDMAARGNGRDVPVRIYRARGLEGVLPGLLYLHGGGMIMGSIAADDGFAAALAEEAECVVASVGYGLAPEHPGTGPAEDCYAALSWLHESAGALGVDPDRLALFGASAGGGLAVGAALLARERGGPAIIRQMLVYPMLDDRSATAAAHGIEDIGVWDRAANREAWGLLLGERAGSGAVPPEAAPARAADLGGLPPTYVEVGDLDLFLAEDLAFAERLHAAGVPVELHRWPGAYHGFDQLAPRARLTRTAMRNRIAALERAFAPEPRDVRRNGTT